MESRFTKWAVMRAAEIVLLCPVPRSRLIDAVKAISRVLFVKLVSCSRRRECVRSGTRADRGLIICDQGRALLLLSHGTGTKHERKWSRFMTCIATSFFPPSTPITHPSSRMRLSALLSVQPHFSSLRTLPIWPSLVYDICLTDLSLDRATTSTSSQG